MDTIFYLPWASGTLNERIVCKVERVNLQVSGLVWDYICDRTILVSYKRIIDFNPFS